MEVELIDIKTEHVILQDNSEFFYTIKPVEITNVLGNVIAVLDEYIFVSAKQNSEKESYKLYRTKEGNWYDIAETKSPIETTILRSLKSAMERK
jgi:hypothetical protein